MNLWLRLAVRATLGRVFVMSMLRPLKLSAVILIASACATGTTIDEGGQMDFQFDASAESSTGGVYTITGGSFGSGGLGAGGLSATGGSTSGGRTGDGGNGDGGMVGIDASAGMPSDGGAMGDGGDTGDGGAMGDGGDTGDGGASNMCPAGEKFCAGNCFAPNPGIGCGLTGCTGCGAPPMNSFRKCTANMCDFECNFGFKLNAAGDGCDVNPDAGPPPGSGGTPGAGGASGATCTPGDTSRCPICAGPQCCKPDGTCGCNTFWIPVCG